MSPPATGADVPDPEQATAEDTFDEDAPLTKREPRLKSVSDLGGMENGRIRAARKDRRTVSDMVLFANLPDEVKQKRQRMKSSSDTVKKFSQMGMTIGDQDLRYAEEIASLGTRRERIASGISDMVVKETIEEEEKEEESFPFNEEGLTTEEAERLLAIHGKNMLPEQIESKWVLLFRILTQPMPIMIWLAILIEAGIQNFLDMGILFGIQVANASISFYETTKAGDAVAALKSSLKPAATVKRDGKFKVIDATLLVPGDTVLLASGSAIPADCRVNHAEIEVDQAALTGESLPVTMYKGDSCKMGSTVVRGEVEGTVEFTGANTFFGKTASLLVDTHELSHLQIILLTIMKVLVGLSLLLCTINFIYLMSQGVDFQEALAFTIVLLVASIPLAIEIVTTTTLAIGSKDLAKHGAIVAKLSAIEDLAGMSILCSDKTGTLTLNKMVLQEDTPIYSEGETQESVLKFAAMAAKWKDPPRDALDTLTLGSVNMSLLEDWEHVDFVPFDPQFKRTEGTVVNKKTGEQYKTSKGAPHIIMNLLDKSDTDVIELVERDVARLGAKGIRSLAVAKTNPEGVWKMMGLLTFLDPPRPDTKQTIIFAREYGVGVKMITGDHLLIARNTAEQLDMGDRIFTAERLPMLDMETKKKPDKLSETYGDLCLAADGFAQVFPEHKYLIVECLREMHYTVGMTGDGVNDAPALKRADIGIAVAGATDAARAAADIILTEEGLGTIIHGIVIAREIFSRISNFITYRISATLQLLFFFFIAVFAFQPRKYNDEWDEFFHMPVLMLMLITLLNDGTLITIAYDYARANQTPDKWNLPALSLSSSTLALVSCCSSLLLLHLLLDSGNPNGFMQKLGMDPATYGEITNAIYLKVSVSDFLTLFSARTGSLFFWKVKPAPMLLAGGCIALAISSLLALLWPETTLDDIEVQGLKENPGLFVFVWLFSLFFWMVQDVFKVLCYKYMYAVNFYGINDTGVVVLPESALKLMKELDVALSSAPPGHH